MWQEGASAPLETHRDPSVLVLPFLRVVHGGTRGALCACGRASRCVQRASAMDGAVREHFVQAVAANGSVPSPLLHEPPALLVLSNVP